MFKFHRKKHQNNKNCLKCQYQNLYEKGRKVFEAWDQKGKPPKELVNIQKQLMTIKKTIEADQDNNELEFCANHPTVFEYLPIEWI